MSVITLDDSCSHTHIENWDTVGEEYLESIIIVEAVGGTSVF